MNPPPPKKLLDQVQDVITLKHYSRSTGQTYAHWIKRFVLFHHKKHPKEMGAPEIEQSLTSLAKQENVSASTQNQALSALLFLYRHVLKQDIPFVQTSMRAQKPKLLPTVLTKEEAQLALILMTGTHQLMAKLLYGSGLRLTLAPRLRAAQVQVWNASNCASRIWILPIAKSSCAMAKAPRTARLYCLNRSLTFCRNT